ncbi:glycoside hydrolase family 16 protein [Nocardioides iriomotensis]|nr:glycoside hydrolase family 16 protein [Nocardioides iriomotensis]
MTETTDRAATPRPSEPGRRKARRQGRPGLSPEWRKGLLIFAFVVLVGTGIFYAGRALTTADPAQLQIRVATPRGGVMPGERFTIEGSATESSDRPVYLERQVRGAWSRMETLQTTSAGAFVFSGLQVDAPARLRVVLPEVSQLGQRHPAVTQVLPRVQVTKQAVPQFSVLPGVVQNGAVPAEAGAASLFAEATFSPIRPGREVYAQRRLPGGDWERVGKDTQGAEGKVRFQVPQDATTPYQYRVLAAGYKGAPEAASPAQASNRWRLDFDDEFTYGVDSATWLTRGDVHAPDSSRTCARADSSMVSASGDGAARLSAQRDPAYAPDSCSWKNPSTGASGTESYYLNSHVGTQGTYSFRYGVAAARVKFQQPQGMHGAFWLQDSGEAGGTIGAEIDTVEFFGKGYAKGGIASFIYPSQGEEVGGTQPDASEALTGPRDNWWDRYHVFSVEWTPEAYVFRIDGVETLRVEENVADKKAFLIMSLLTSDWELKRMPEAGAGQMDVDWVRVWQDTRLNDQNL